MSSYPPPPLSAGPKLSDSDSDEAMELIEMELRHTPSPT